MDSVLKQGCWKVQRVEKGSSINDVKQFWKISDTPSPHGHTFYYEGLSTAVTKSWTPSPLRRDVIYGWPQTTVSQWANIKVNKPCICQMDGKWLIRSSTEISLAFSSWRLKRHFAASDRVSTPSKWHGEDRPKKLVRFVSAYEIFLIL